MHPVRFELTPPKRTELESVALDHSAMDAPVKINYIHKSPQRDLNSRPFAYKANALTTVLCGLFFTPPSPSQSTAEGFEPPRA
jgi:hypothetical protein